MRFLSVGPRLIVVVALGGLCLIAASQILADGPPPGRVVADSEIRTMLTERVARRQSVGIVVGIIEPQGRRIVAYGTRALVDRQPVSGDTVFEIGSITKVFTSLILADMVRRGEVALDDPVAKYLPPDVRVPERKGRKITLVHLATHMSGLPREALNFQPVWENWESGYSERALYEFLGSHQLAGDIGSEQEYSNLGVSLLAIALARRAAMDFETLVRTRIEDPLGLERTGWSPTPDVMSRLAPGHVYTLDPAPGTNLRVFAGAGGLRSTANDLLQLLAAQLGYERTPLEPAMAAMLKVKVNLMPPVVRLVLRGQFQHLGWMETGGLIFHSGGTPGYRSFIGFDPGRRLGVVVLSNVAATAGVDDIGMHLLNPRLPLLAGDALQPPKPRQEISVQADVLERYVGRYDYSATDWITVTRAGDQLFIGGSGYPTVRFYPESDVAFFAKTFDEQIVFKVDREARVIEALDTGGGGDPKVYKRIR